MRRFLLLALMLSLALTVPSLPALADDPNPSTMNAQQVNAETARLNTEKQSVEQQIRQISDAPPRPGESLNDEIARKGRETRDLRRRLNDINHRLDALRERSRQLAAASPTPAPTTPAVATGSTPELVPVHDQDYSGKYWQQAGGQESPLWGHGYDARVIEKPAGAQSTNDEHTTWLGGGVSASRLTDDPNDRGWWIDRDGRVQPSFFKDRSTQCQPCRFMVMQFNALMNTLLWRRADVARYNRGKSQDLEYVRQEMQRNRTPGVDDLAFAGMVTARISEVSDAYDARTAAARREVARLEPVVQALAAQIAECEKQCADTVPKSGLTLGGCNGWVPATAGALDRELVFPIRWEGPYRTECPQCANIARSLNGIPSSIWDKMQEIFNARLRLLSVEARTNFDNLFREEDESPYDVEALRRRIQSSIAEQQRRLAQVVLEFHRLVGQLAACEREHCPDRRHGMVPGTGSVGGEYVLFDPEVELEHTVFISGTNPFDAREIERIPNMVNNTEFTGSAVITPTPPVVAITPPVTTPPAGGSSSGGTVTTPLSVSSTGTISFSHMVGTTTCPQFSGNIGINSNNGNPLTVSGISVSGDLSTRVNTSVVGDGSATPSIRTEFNCSSAQNGTFTGTLTATVTDTTTNETAAISASGSGTITGP